MSGRRKKNAQSPVVEPANLSVRKENDDGSTSPYLQESVDSLEMPAGNFLKLEWNSENSPADQESVEVKNRYQTEEEEVEVVVGEETDTAQEEEENDLYMNYSMLTDHLISGHFLSGATAEEVYVFNGEPSRSKKVISDILCDKFKCHHCNLSFLSHMFYKNHLKKCALRRTSAAQNKNNNSISVNFNSDGHKRKSMSKFSNSSISKIKRSGRLSPGSGQSYLCEEGSSDVLESSEFNMNMEDIMKSRDSLNYKCDSCKCLFTSFNEMKDHVCFRNTQHQCDMCLVKCPTKAAFYEHLERSHKIQISSILSSASPFPVLGNKKQYDPVISNEMTKNMSNNVFFVPLYVVNNGSELPRKSS